MTALNNVGLQVSDLLLTLFAAALLIRALAHRSGALDHHPLLRFILAVTEPVLSVPHKILPPNRDLDLSCWLAAYLVCVLEIYMRAWFLGAYGPALSLLLFALFASIELLLYIYIVAIVVSAVASWFMPPYQLISNPVVSLFQLLIAPLLAPLRRFLPTFDAVDVSPMVLLLIIYVALIVLRSFY